ncbi:MAG: hypothetical protein R3C29_17875 [Dehalococcoidia bacterium]
MPELPVALIARSVTQLAALGRDPELIRATVEAARAEADRQRPALAAEAKRVRREKAEVTGKAQRLLDALAAAPEATASIAAEITRHEDTAATLDARLAEIDAQLAALDRHGNEAEEVAAALRDFDAVWRALHPRERERLVRIIIEKVNFHGTSGEVEITWREGFGGGR